MYNRLSTTCLAMSFFITHNLPSAQNCAIQYKKFAVSTISTHRPQSSSIVEVKNSKLHPAVPGKSAYLEFTSEKRKLHGARLSQPIAAKHIFSLTDKNYKQLISDAKKKPTVYVQGKNYCTHHTKHFGFQSQNIMVQRGKRAGRGR
jgi:hypothetical protein